MNQEKRNPGELPGAVACRIRKANNENNYIIAYLADKSRLCSVIPDSVYHFKKLEKYAHVYILEGIEGEVIPDFPSIYKQGELAGRRYITFRKTVMQHLKGRFPYTLELDNARMFTGLKMSVGKDGIARGYGDNRNAGRRDCVLVALSQDVKSLDIAFIKNAAKQGKETFLAWLEDVERAAR